MATSGLSHPHTKTTHRVSYALSFHSLVCDVGSFKRPEIFPPVDQRLGCALSASIIKSWKTTRNCGKQVSRCLLSPVLPLRQALPFLHDSIISDDLHICVCS